MYHSLKKDVEAAPPSTWTSPQILKDFLMFMKHYTIAFMMYVDILEKDPSKVQKLNDGMKPLFPYVALFNKKGGITAAEINQNANKMANVSNTYYEFMKKEAKAAGVPVVLEVPKPSKRS